MPNQDIGIVWNKRRNDGKYLPHIPPLERTLTHPQPWPKDLVEELAKVFHARVIIPNSSKGQSWCYKFFHDTLPKIPPGFH
jgi:hypothetical protein